jgi:hypothetical protein
MDAGRTRGRRAIALLLAVVAAGLAACGSTPHATPRPKATPVPTPTVNPSASFEAKYASLHQGLSLDDVRGIMGSPGSTMSEADNGAGMTSVVLQWQDPKSSGHSIIVDFVNNVMQTKSAIGF